MSEAETPTGGDLLVAEDVRKEFGGLVAVNDLSFTIPRRAIVSLIGPNGAGKTTFFNTLTGLYKVTDGFITFDGEDVTYVAPNKRDMGMVFQAYSLFPNMTAAQNVEFGLRIRKVAAAERRRKRELEEGTRGAMDEPLYEMRGANEPGAGERGASGGVPRG